MTFKQELVQRQIQQLAMTQQLQLAIRMLQLNRLELKDLVDQEFRENPTLEEADGGEPYRNEGVPAIDLDIPGPPPESAEAAPLDFDSPQMERNLRASAQGDGGEVDWDRFVENLSYGGSTAGPQMAVPDEDDERPLEGRMAGSSSLSDYLLWQFNLQNPSDEEYAVGEEIIGNLDDRGYLVELTLDDIARRHELSLELVSDVHARILHFDPIGVGARDLTECLLAQAEVLVDPENAGLVNAIISHHLEKIAKGRLDLIARELDADPEQVKEAVAVIRRMEPQPGRNYSGEDAQMVEPDVTVYKEGDAYRIETNHGGLPSLRISTFYRQMIRNREQDREARQYVKEKLRSAAWLIRSLDQRHRTIYRVAEILVREQRDFLEKGIEYIRPMSLKEVAEELRVHESTVSRATSNKYMATPRGVHCMKVFFHTGVETDSGDSVSPELIKRRIKKLVEEEAPDNPLSDVRIWEILTAEGVHLARRTVAKYREMANIAPRSARRRRI